MRKNHWISLAIALVIAGSFAYLEQRRGAYYLEPLPDVTPPAESRDTLDKKCALMMQGWELALYGARFKLSGTMAHHPDIVIIGIDEYSLKELHQWPWPRGIHAQLVRLLQHHPPKALLFDVLFIEPYTLDPKGDRELVQATKA